MVGCATLGKRTRRLRWSAATLRWPIPGAGRLKQFECGDVWGLPSQKPTLGNLASCDGKSSKRVDTACLRDLDGNRRIVFCTG